MKISNAASIEDTQVVAARSSLAFATAQSTKARLRALTVLFRGRPTVFALRLKG